MLGLYVDHTTLGQVETDSAGTFSATVSLNVSCRLPAEPVHFIVQTPGLDLLADQAVNLLDVVGDLLNCVTGALTSSLR